MLRSLGAAESLHKFYPRKANPSTVTNKIAYIEPSYSLSKTRILLLLFNVQKTSSFTNNFLLLNGGFIVNHLYTQKMRLFIKNRITPIIVGCLVLSTMSQTLMGALAQETTPITSKSLSYTTLATFFPAPLLPVKTEKEEKLDLSNPLEKAKYLKKQLEAGIAEVSQDERRKTTFDLYAAQEKPVLEKESTLTLIKDLELFVNENASKDASILSSIDRTQTTFGKVHLAHLLANPTRSLDELTKRQTIIRELVENEELFNHLDRLLTKVKDSENGLFSLWQAEDETAQDYIQKNFFFKSKILSSLNTKPVAMELSNKLGNISTLKNGTDPVSSYLGGTYIMAKAMYYAAYFTISCALKGDPRKEEALAEIVNPSFKQLALEIGSAIKKGCSPSTYKEIYNDILISTAENSTPKTSRNLALLGTSAVGAAAAGIGVWWAWNAYSAASEAALKQSAANRLHQKLIDAGTIVTCSKELNLLAQTNTVLVKGLTTEDNLSRLFKPSDNQEFDALIVYLQTNTFKGSPSFFSYSGRVLASHELIKQHKDRLTSAFKALGEIDAYLSIAKLYKESQDANTHYSFAHYEQKERPSITLNGFWHPLVASDKVVKNNLTLGQDHGFQNIILTGSNTGGKSTLLKGVLLSLLLAQTCTIVPADELSFTPFAHLGSYLHISDNISAGISLFKAEVLRAKALMDETSDLQFNDFAFVVIDELFTGTAADKGAAAAEKVADKLMQKENVIYVLATHFPSLTDLEEITHGVCKNFKIDVIKNEDGSITRPFKIEPGVSTTSIANDLLQEEMTDIDFTLID